MLAEVVDSEGGCPACGVVSSRVKDRPLSRVRDVPHAAVALRLRVRKRRFVCLEALCPRRSFTQASAQLPARSRVTTRLRERVGAAVAGANRAVSEVAAECGIAWATAHRILVLAAAAAAGPAVPTAMIGIDETRAPKCPLDPGGRRRHGAVATFGSEDDLDRGLGPGTARGGSSGSPPVAPAQASRRG